MASGALMVTRLHVRCEAHWIGWGGLGIGLIGRKEWREIMMYATQYRESYPYYQHEKIGYNYRMSNICAVIGRGQMTVADDYWRV